MDRKTTARVALIALAGASLAACATVQPKYATRASGAGGVTGGGSAGAGGYKVGEPYQVGGIWYVPREQPGYDEVGTASWYGEAFNMKATANGEVFDMNQFSAAHTTLPLPSIVEVTNLDNGRKMQVRVNDRGPFVGGRIIDLSRAAAAELGYDRKGLARVRVRYVGPAPLAGPAAGVRYASAGPAAAAPGTTVAPAQPVEVATLAPAPSAVTVSTLPPLTGAALGPRSSAVASAAPSVSAPTVTSAATASQPFRVQAGAFSSEVNAQRAAQQLATTGQAVVEPMQRGGVTLYRVVLPGLPDEVAAYALRDRVASIGFTDARVVQAF